MTYFCRAAQAPGFSRGEDVNERMNHRASGAAGVHSDQLARRSGALAGNRQRTRSARRRAAIADQD